MIYESTVLFLQPSPSFKNSREDLSHKTSVKSKWSKISNLITDENLSKKGLVGFLNYYHPNNLIKLVSSSHQLALFLCIWLLIVCNYLGRLKINILFKFTGVAVSHDVVRVKGNVSRLSHLDNYCFHLSHHDVRFVLNPSKFQCQKKKKKNKNPGKTFFFIFYNISPGAPGYLLFSKASSLSGNCF